MPSLVLNNWALMVAAFAAMCRQVCHGCMPMKIPTEVHITKTRLSKYIENFTTKEGKFSDKKKF